MHNKVVWHYVFKGNAKRKSELVKQFTNTYTLFVCLIFNLFFFFRLICTYLTYV